MAMLQKFTASLVSRPIMQ